MPKPYLSPKGRKVADELVGPKGADVMESLYRRRSTHVDESWARLSGDWVMNGMYARDVLDSGTRELCAVAALTAIGAHEELRLHIRMALRSNKKAAHVREAILQMAVYAGMPAALAGARIFDKVMEEPEFRKRSLSAIQPGTKR
jgi:4-carboxymuconolactone decarboxylase